MEDLIKRRSRDKGQIALSLIWEDITSDSVLDIRKVRSAKSALKYLVKYILKPPFFPEVRNYLEYLRSVENKPLIMPFGSLRNQKEPERELVCACGRAFFWFVTVVDSFKLEQWLSGLDPPSCKI